ncbi:MAG: DUF2840 domain-containing protein [Pseudomonadota bacterium]
MMADRERRFTIIVCAYRKNRLNRRLLFGRPAFDIRRGWRRKFVCFEPGEIFAYEAWRADRYGTQDWRLVVAQTVHAGPLARLPGVFPGADPLLYASGVTQVRTALKALDQLRQSAGGLTAITPAYWRHLQNRLQTKQEPHDFTRLQAAAR